MIDELGVRNVEIMNGHVSRMSDVYASVHATIVPGLEHNSLKPSPFSALESLAHGKPVLASAPTSVGRMVRRHACGVCFDPMVEDLVAAIDLLRRHYAHFSVACHAVIERKFSRTVFRERYLSLYEAILARQTG
jgi:glycosyltransferase involved in cell wall biosynthesis